MYNKSITINRYQPNIMNELSSGRFQEIINNHEFYKPNLKKNLISDALSTINQSKSLNLSKNILTLKRYIHDQIQLPSTNALIYETTQEVNELIATYSPPTMQEIFNTWYRFSHGSNDGGHATLSNIIPAAPLETNQWFYNSTTQQVYTTLNSPSHIGFVSDEELEHYEHNVTLQAFGGDNDMIGVIIAFYKDPNDLIPNNAHGMSSGSFTWPMNTTSPTIPNEHTIVLNRPHGNDSMTRVEGQNFQFGISYNYRKLNQKILANGHNLVWQTTSGFNGDECDVKIIRNGNIIQVWTTNWTSAPGGKGNFIGPLTIDLDSDPDLFKFKGRRPYGYSAHSQNDSTFKNVTLIGGVDRGTIVNAATSTLHKFNETTGTWSSIPISLQQLYGYERIVNNPETGKSFLIRQNDILIL